MRHMEYMHRKRPMSHLDKRKSLAVRVRLLVRV